MKMSRRRPVVPASPTVAKVSDRLDCFTIVSSKTDEDFVKSLWPEVRNSNAIKITTRYLRDYVEPLINDFESASNPTIKKLIAWRSHIYTSKNDIDKVVNYLGYVPEAVFESVSRLGTEYNNSKRICSICYCYTRDGTTFNRINVCKDCKI